jgi:hypothetical protein
MRLVVEQDLRLTAVGERFTVTMRNLFHLMPNVLDKISFTESRPHSTEIRCEYHLTTP